MQSAVFGQANALLISDDLVVLYFIIFLSKQRTDSNEILMNDHLSLKIYRNDDSKDLLYYLC